MRKALQLAAVSAMVVGASALSYGLGHDRGFKNGKNFGLLEGGLIIMKNMVEGSEQVVQSEDSNE